MKNISIVFCGVGGHGVITASKLIGKAALKANLNVISSEIHGMAQRGGAVITTIRVGDFYSPLVPDGGADIIVSTEPLEALRSIKKASKKTIVITDINPVIPFTVTISGEKYPKLEDIYKEIEKRCKKLIKIDALVLAKKAGSTLSKNIVLLGALAGMNVLPFDTKFLLETIKESLPKPFEKTNIRAFKEGMNAVKNETFD
jgi:indolepyruvate ferredoxin oxidoreductase beta subunit